ncbi:MAG: hypothetical protein PF636_08985, partial [Actinomycetota bacterium]|nr:hypothetical protein [Actinomycetota bacterium]
DAVLRDALAMIRHHPGEPLSSQRVSRAIGHDPRDVANLLDLLAESFVLDFDSETRQYTYGRDVLLDVEIDRYLQHAHVHSGRVQNNVERFRRRYGDR